MNSIMNKLRRFIIGVVSVLAISAIGIFANVAIAATPSAPVVTPDSGVYFTLSNVSIDVDPVEAFVTGYTTDGTVPTFTCDLISCNPDGTTQVYSAPFALNGPDGSTVTLSVASYDQAGLPSLVTTRSYIYDRTAPVINGTLNGEFHNHNLALSISEPHIKDIYVNGVLVPSLLPFTTDGNYTVRVVDQALNEASISFVIDKTAPVLTLNGLNPLTVEVKTPFNDPGVRVDEANNLVTTWTSGNLNTGVVGSYVVTYYAQDEAGNIGQVSRVVNVVDTTVPVVSGVTDGAYYSGVNTPRTISFTDTNTPTATLNGLPFASGETVTAEGNYVLVVSDLGGNVVTINFVIDKTNPTYMLNGIGNGSYYRSVVVVNFADSNLDYATLNGNLISNGYVATLEGNYSLVVYDKAGNQTQTSFTIDKTAPTYNIVGTMGQLNFFRSDVNVYFADAYLSTATINGFAVNSGHYLVAYYAAGAYQLTVTDLAGNMTEVIFVLDAGAPWITESNNGVPVTLSDNSYWNTDISLYTFEDFPYLYTINGISYNIDNPLVLSVEGVYVIFAEDMAGNQSQVTVTIDKTNPTASTTGTEGQAGYFRSDVIVNFSDLNLASATVDGVSVSDGDVITSEGVHTLVVTDKAGNVTKIVFTIDKTNPTASATGAEGQAGYFRSDVIVNFSDLNLASATVDGVSVSDGDVITSEGVHTLVVTDKAGNVTTIVFTIDKTNPWVSGAVNNGYYPGAITIGFGDQNFLTASLNGSPISPGDIVSVDGNYILVVVDRAGNITTVSFVIDSIDPDISGITVGGFYNHDVLITFSDLNLDYATLNGNPVNNGDYATQEGDYTLIVVDKAGNISTVSFTIDKTAPAVFGVTSGGFYNNTRTITFSDLHLAGATLNGNPFVSGSSVSIEGTYILDVYDLAGNHTVIVFTIDITPPLYVGVTDGSYYNHSLTITFTDAYPVSATLNGNVFVSGQTVSAAGSYVLEITDSAGNKTTVTFVIDYSVPSVSGVADGEYYNSQRTINFSDNLTVNATLNGQSFISGSVVMNAGHYVLTVTDIAGNSVTINFYIDYTNPTVSGVVDGVFYNSNRIITFGDSSPAIATLNGNVFTSGSVVSSEGTYVLVVIDAAGNQTVVSFVIDKTDPVITLKGDNPFVLEVGSEYKEPGFSAVDDVDGDLSSQVIVIGVVDNKALGLNIITYQVTDRAGNVSTIMRIVKVVDTTKPVITLNGNSELTLNVGDSYVELGAKALDNYDGDITSKLVVSGSVDTSKEGTYTIVYTVTDANGNTSTLTRTIKVVEKPVVIQPTVQTTPAEQPAVKGSESNNDQNLGGESKEIIGDNIQNKPENIGLKRLVENLRNLWDDFKLSIKENTVIWIIILIILMAATASLYFYFLNKKIQEDSNI